ncbi:MAG: metallophosphoesterase family protein [Candidatus Hydrogenedentes bacterium]|nr:metallophosphoesterase family protein [Candidatus Hydrogenedentota bacterium]
MYLAAIGDIHGNLPALEAVLAAIDEQGIQTVVNAGDLVVGHPWPNEVIDLTRNRNIPSVQGELDRRVVHFLRKQETLRRKLSEDEFEALRQTHVAIQSYNLEFLRSLPRRRMLHVEGIDICVCHGTPTSQSDTLDEEDPPGKFRRARELTNAQIVISGATHRPFSRTVDGTLFVNPGSAGMSPGVARVATYAIVDTETDPWEARIQELDY